MTNQLESNNLSSLQWYNKDHIAKPFVSFNSEAFISFNASAQSILPPYVTIAYNEKNDEISKLLGSANDLVRSYQVFQVLASKLNSIHEQK